VRIPAALLTGAAIGQLFTTLDDKRGKMVPILFTLLSALAVSCELSVVFFSTAISTRLLGGGFDPMATDALTMLIREFEFPFLFCRVHFFVGLLSFVGALTLRAWTAFQGPLGNSLALTMAASTFIMLNFFNATILNFKLGLAGLLWRYAQLFAARATSSATGAIAAVMILAAAYYACKAASEEAFKARPA